MNKLFALVLAIATFIGIFYTVFFIPWILNDPSSAWYRLTNHFLSAWSAIPLGIIGFGTFIIFDGIRKRHHSRKDITYKLILCGTLILMLGFAFFWLYIID